MAHENVLCARHDMQMLFQCTKYPNMFYMRSTNIYFQVLHKAHLFIRLLLSIRELQPEQRHNYFLGLYSVQV